MEEIDTSQTNPQNNSEADEVDAISTVALLIDDLSSEDPNAKMHSIQRLGQIAQLLGPERCIDELIPMLTELIDKIDCNPELMMAMAEQLGQLTDYLNTDSENVSHLLRPLEMIVASDDNVVQKKAVESLRKVSTILPDHIIHTEYLELIRRLKKGDIYSMRIAACQLYADIYARLNPEKREVVRKKFAKLVKDDTPMVRWGAAQSMTALSKHLEKENLSAYLLPMLKQLLTDSNDSVKVHAVASSITVARLLNDSKLIAENILPALKQAHQNKQSWRLRFSVAECAAEISKHVEKSRVDAQILPIYVTLMGDSEPEVRSEAVNKLPDMAENCSGALIVSKVLPGLKLQLATESSQHVKGSMAYVVCKMATKLSQEEATTHLIPMVSILLKNNTTEVLVSLVENLDELVKVLGGDALQEKLLPALINLTNDKTWRIRLAVVKFIPKLSTAIDRTLFQEKLEGPLISMLTDPVFTVRQQTVQSLLQLSTLTFDNEWLENLFDQKLAEFSKSDRFMLRIQSVFIMNALKGHVSNNLIESRFSQVLTDLAADPVPNVRFNVSKTVDMYYDNFSQSAKAKLCEALQKMADSDTDFDSKFYAQKTLERVKAA